MQIVPRDAESRKAQQCKRKSGQRARHIMPGIVPDIASQFRTPRKHYTLLALQEDTKLPQGFITSGLLHHLYDSVDRTMKRLAAVELRQDGFDERLSVREFRIGVAA